MNSLDFGYWFDVLSDRPSAWLMAHMTYWMPKAKTKRDGKVWIVRSFREFRDDHNFPYSERTLKRAVARLKSEGLIEVSMAPHPYRREAMRARWLRLVSN